MTAATRWTVGAPAYLQPERPNILAVDPGKVTGILHLRPGASPDAGTLLELDCEEALDWCAALLASDTPPTEVVCETFTITARTARNTQAPWSLESIGVLRFLTRRQRIPLHMQQPALAKRGAANDRLKHAGWYVPTSGGHSADAARHAYVRLLNLRLLSPPILNM